MNDLEPRTLDETILIDRIQRRYASRLWDARGSLLQWLMVSFQMRAAIRSALEDRRRLMQLALEKDRVSCLQKDSE